MRLKYNYIICPFSFLPSSLPIYPILLSFKFMAYFPIIAVTCIYVYIPKYKLLSLYRVICDHLLSDSQLVRLSQKTIAPTLCVGARSPSLALIHMGMSVVELGLLMFR